MLRRILSFCGIKSEEYPICGNPLAPFDPDDKNAGSEEFRMVASRNRLFTPNYAPGFPKEMVPEELHYIRHTTSEWKALDQRFEIMDEDGWRGEYTLDENETISCADYLNRRRMSTLKVKCREIKNLSK